MWKKARCSVLSVALAVLIALAVVPTALTGEATNGILENLNSVPTAGAYSARSRLAKQENGASLVAAYDILAQGVASGAGSVSLYGITPRVYKESVNDIVNAFIEDNPYAFWYKSYFLFSDGTYLKTLILSYSISVADIPVMRSQISDAARECLWGINSGMSDYQKEKIIHDRLVTRVKLDESSKNSGNMYGALVEGKANSKGLAMAYKHLLNLAGIEADCVLGKSGGKDAYWNIVKIGGDYYYCDISLDIPKENTAVNKAYYLGMNITTAKLKENHIIGNESRYPLCSANKCNYFVKENSVFDTFDAERLGDIMASNGGFADVYVTNVQSFVSGFNGNIEAIKSKLKISGSVSSGVIINGSEIVPYIIPNQTTTLFGCLADYGSGPYTVSLTPVGNSTPSYITESDGVYSFSGVIAGEYAFKSVSDFGAVNESVITVGENIIEEFDSLLYSFGGKCGDGVCWLLDTVSGKFDVSGSGNMSYDSVPWFEVKSCIKSVVIDNGVGSIESDAFSDCNNLLKITVLNDDCDIFDDIDTIPPPAVIYSHEKSNAQSYAKKYGKPFSAITSVIYGASISAGSDITLNYYADDADGLPMRFTANGVSSTACGNYDSKTGKCLYRFTGITPERMGDCLKAELIKDGYSVSVKDDFSVKDYCKGILNGTADSLGFGENKFSKLKTLICDLLNYGAAVQKCCGYKTDTLVNDGITGSEFTPPLSTDKDITNKSADGVDFTGETLVFDSVNKIAFKFTLNGVDKSNVEIKIGNGESEKTVKSDEFVRIDENTYAVYTDGICATEFDDVYTATAFVNGISGANVKYSVNSYVYSKYNDEGETEELRELVKMLYNYGLSAKAYVVADDF